MKLYNIVFSPTGGTKKVADYLINALEGEAATVDLTGSKQNFDAVSLTKEDVAVISVPSYGGRVPAVAVERLGMVHGTLLYQPHLDYAGRSGDRNHAAQCSRCELLHGCSDG